MTTTYQVGLDLGQLSDPTALAVSERNVDAAAVARYAIRHLHRWPLKTAYPDIVADVRALLEKPPLAGATLVVDATGVGRAVVDLFRRAELPGALVAVTITAGDKVVAEGSEYRVPKRDLAGVLHVLLGQQRLTIARTLRLAKVLAKEMQTFSVKVN